MTDYKQRVKDEKNDLDGKIERLSTYIQKPEFKNVDYTQQELMKQQLGIMKAYSLILSQRIENFE